MMDNTKETEVMYSSVDVLEEEDHPKSCEKFWFIPSPGNPELKYYAEPSFSSRIKKVSTKKLLLSVYDNVERNWFKVLYGRRSEAWISRQTENGRDQLHQVHNFVAYQAWPGQNLFFCDGRIMLGNDIQGAVAVFICIVGATCFELIYIFPKFGPSSKVLYASLTFTLLAIYNLWKVISTEPGIIPRNSPFLELEVPVDEESEQPMLKYCEICNLYQPKNTKHCNYCGNCVREFDHHCGVVGTCIGLRNYFFFIRFLFFTGVLACVYCSCDLFMLWASFQSSSSGTFISRIVEVIGSHTVVVIGACMTGQLSLMLISLAAYFIFIYVKGEVNAIQSNGNQRSQHTMFWSCMSISFFVLKKLFWCQKLPQSLLPSLTDVQLFENEETPQSNVGEDQKIK